MRLTDGYDFGSTKTGAKTHIVDFDGSPSALILGSEHYDADTHRRAMCGTISEMKPADEPDGKSGYCYACVQAGFARGYIDDLSPFDVDGVQGRERHTSDRHKNE